MESTNLKNKRLFFILSFFIFFVTFLLRLPAAVFPPTDVFYEPLERSIVFNTLGFFVGLVPGEMTFWSIGIFGIPLLLLYTLDFLLINLTTIISVIRCNPGALVKGLSIYLASAFLNPTRQLIIGRLLVAFITSFAPLALLAFFRKRNRPVAAIASVIIFLTSPLLLKHNYSLQSDSLGVTFFTFALVILLGQEQLNSKGIFLGSIFLGLAMVGKFSYVAFLPAAFLAALFARIPNPNKAFFSRTRNVLIFTIGILLPIVIFIPFLWTSALVLAKNIAGALREFYCRGSSSWRPLLLECIPFFTSYVGLPLAVIGIVSSFFVLHKKTAILIAVGFFSFLFSLGNADTFLMRYALPLMPFLALYAGIGLDFIARAKKNNFRILFVTLVIGIISVGNLTSVIKDFKTTHNNTNRACFVNWIKENMPPGSNIAIPEYLAYFFIPSETTLEGWLDNANKSYDNIGRRLLPLFATYRVEYNELGQENPLVSKVFGTTEQQKIFVYKTLLWYFKNVEKPQSSYNLFLYVSDAEHGLSIIAAKKRDILNLFLEGKIDLFVSDEHLPAPCPSLIRYFGRYPGQAYYIYLNKRP